MLHWAENGWMGFSVSTDRQKATRARAKPLQNSANSQCDDLRKNPDIRGFFQLQRRVPDRRAMYSIEPVRLTIGHY